MELESLEFRWMKRFFFFFDTSFREFGDSILQHGPLSRIMTKFFFFSFVTGKSNRAIGWQSMVNIQNNNRDLHFKIAHFFFFFFFYLKHPSNIMQNIFVFLHTLRLKNSKIELAPLLQGPQFRVFADSSRRKRNKRIPPCLIICLPPSNVIELPSV